MFRSTEALAIGLAAILAACDSQSVTPRDASAGPCAPGMVGWQCIDQTAIDCDGDGVERARVSCAPSECVAGIGCVRCTPNEARCAVDQLLRCNGAGTGWDVEEVCEPGLFCADDLLRCVDECALAEANGAYIGFIR